jgi:WD40 repeat protein
MSDHKIEVADNDPDNHIIKLHKKFDNIQINIVFDIDKPHNGKSIDKIEISPNEKYLVTYSEEDNSIVGWNAENVDEVKFKSEFSAKFISDISDEKIYIDMCVSNDKKLVLFEIRKQISMSKIMPIRKPTSK